MGFQRVDLEGLKSLHANGVLYGVFETTPEDYHAAPGVSSTMLSRMEQSPATYRHAILNPEPPTDAMEKGTILHTLVLEPETFFDRYAVAPPELDRRDMRIKAWAAFCEANPGKHVLKEKEYNDAKEIADAARKHSRVNLLEGHKELSFFWKDPGTGLVCKCRPDNITVKGIITDYKTAEEVYPKRVWSNHVASYGYHRQGAFYLDGVTYALQQADTSLPDTEPIKAFCHYAQEKKGALLVKPWLLGSASIELGRRSYASLLTHIKECEIKNTWPGYPEALEPIECPEWMWLQEEERMAAAV